MEFKILDKAGKVSKKTHSASDAIFGNDINESILADFIQLLDIPQDAKQELLELTPSKYTGLASKLIR